MPTEPSASIKQELLRALCSYESVRETMAIDRCPQFALTLSSLQNNPGVCYTHKKVQVTPISLGLHTVTHTHTHTLTLLEDTLCALLSLERQNAL